jgi:hypothetical protein
MNKAIVALRGVVGLIGAFQVGLGTLFWTGRAIELVRLHMILGAVFVLALWSLVVLDARAPGRGPAWSRRRWRGAR